MIKWDFPGFGTTFPSINVIHHINKMKDICIRKIQIATRKPVAFLYANNKLTEREIKKTIPFTIVIKRIK